MSNMMLSVEISHTKWVIPLEKVHYIDYVENITPLPFTGLPIEGLTQFNNQPLIQVNLAQALGLEDRLGNKSVIVTTSQGEVALRVDEVLDFIRPNLPETSPPLLPLTEILAWTRTVNPVRAKPAITTSPNRPITYHLTALLVVAGNKIVALSSHTIERIEAIDSFQSIEYKGIQPDLLIKVKDELLPAYSLTRFLNHDETGSKQKAVIVRGAHGHWALAVEQVLELENIHQIYTTGTDTHELWYLTTTGEIREIINANQLIGGISESNPIPITQPQWTQSFIHMTEPLSNDGLRITCGNNNYVLPLTIAYRTIDEQLNHSLMTRQRFLTPERLPHKTRIPWINSITLLSGKPGILAPQYTILITLVQQGQILLGVDRVLLQPTLIKGAWITLTNLPVPTSLFFDAATYEEQTGQWILRVTDSINFAKLPWSIKKAVVKAIEGWFDLEVITESK